MTNERLRLNSRSPLAASRALRAGNSTRREEISTMRILIADDTRCMREAIREIVELDSFEIAAEACDGEEAVALYQKTWPELVLLDLVMPKLSGIDALQRIRRIDPNACVVACCSLGQDDLVARALECGALDYVMKPFHPDDLREAIDNVVRRYFKPTR